MRKTLIFALSLFLCLSLAACTPTGEATPSPTPETASAHSWSGYGYSYTSETLGIRIEFPPEWKYYFGFTEEESEIYFVMDQDGNSRDGLVDSTIKLYPKGVTFNGESPLATIFFLPKGMTLDPPGGAVVALTETEEGTYYCEMDTMLIMWHLPEYEAGGDQVAAEFAILESVQGGIQDGRWEIEVLDPKA